VARLARLLAASVVRSRSMCPTSSPHGLPGALPGMRGGYASAAEQEDPRWRGYEVAPQHDVAVTGLRGQARHSAHENHKSSGLDRVGNPNSGVQALYGRTRTPEVADWPTGRGRGRHHPRRHSRLAPPGQALGAKRGSGRIPRPASWRDHLRRLQRGRGGTPGQ
jgi:hypothetical protein